MKTSQMFIVVAIAIISLFFGILSMFGMPTSLMEWIISDIALGAILFISYLVIASRYGSKSKIRNPLNKVTV